MSRWTRPRRSVWSQPQRLGTDSVHFLCTFMSQAGGAQLVRRWTPKDSDYCELELQLQPTLALHPLVGEAVQDGAALVAHGAARLVVVLHPGVRRAGLPCRTQRVTHKHKTDGNKVSRNTELLIKVEIHFYKKSRNYFQNNY